jgi:hypothetical protein
MRNKNRCCRYENDYGIPFVPQRRRRKVSQQRVPDDASAQRGGEGQHHHSQQVQIRVDRGHRPFGCEYRRPGQIGQQQQTLRAMCRSGLFSLHWLPASWNSGF